MSEGTEKRTISLTTEVEFERATCDGCGVRTPEPNWPTLLRDFNGPWRGTFRANIVGWTRLWKEADSEAFKRDEFGARLLCPNCAESIWGGK